MKKIIFLFALSLFTLCFNLNAEAKRIKLHESFSDVNGNTWKIDGWIEVGFFPPSMNGWDVWLTDGNGKRHHFMGLAFNPNTLNNNALTAYNYTIISTEDPLENSEIEDVFHEINEIALSPVNSD